MAATDPMNFELVVSLHQGAIRAEVKCLTPTKADYAFYLLHGDERIDTRPYKPDAVATFAVPPCGLAQLSVKAFSRNRADSEVIWRRSQRLHGLVPKLSGARRTIRFKEWGVNTDVSHTPSAAYLSRSENGAIRNRAYRLRTDETGFIVSGATTDKDSSQIVFLGDSFVECAYVDEGKRFPALVEKELHSQGCLARCLNGGYSGSTSLHLLNVLLNKVVPMRPETVIFFVPTNDGRLTDSDGLYWCKDKLFTPFSPDVPERLAHHADGNFELEMMLDLARTACKHAKIEFRLATCPHRFEHLERDPWVANTYPDHATFATLAQRRSYIFNRVREWSKNSNVDLIDLERLLPNFQKISYDDVHLTEQGCEILAPILTSALLR